MVDRSVEWTHLTSFRVPSGKLTISDPEEPTPNGVGLLVPSSVADIWVAYQDLYGEKPVEVLVSFGWERPAEEIPPHFWAHDWRVGTSCGVIAIGDQVSFDNYVLMDRDGFRDKAAAATSTNELAGMVCAAVFAVATPQQKKMVEVSRLVAGTTDRDAIRIKLK